MKSHDSTQHLFAPFTIQDLLKNIYAIRDSRNVCLAIVGEVDRASEPNNAANARLFAASPDLLTALEDLLADVEYAQPHIVPGLIGNLQIRRAKEAIAKAKGNQ